MGHSTFYAHFQDKEHLFLNGFEALQTQFEQYLVGQSATNEGPWNLNCRRSCTNIIDKISRQKYNHNN